MTRTAVSIAINAPTWRMAAISFPEKPKTTQAVLNFFTIVCATAESLVLARSITLVTRLFKNLSFVFSRASLNLK